MWAKSVLLSAIFAASAFTAPGVSAQPRPHAPLLEQSWTTPVQYRGERGGPPQCSRPLRDAVDELRSRYGGSFVSQQCLEDGGRPIYLIRWRMPDGQLRDFRVSSG
jgi:hypothetical protein